MFYFIYDHGNFLVIREFNDSYDVEIVDRIPFFDIIKINYWCKCANLKFPYEVNVQEHKVSKKIDIDTFEHLDSQMLLDLFDQNVKNGNITLFVGLM